MDQKTRNRFLMIILATALLTTLPYLPTLRGPFFWDDVELIEQSPVLGSPGMFKRAFGNPFFFSNAGPDGALYYRPLTVLSLEVDSRLFNRVPFGFHLTNILLHILCVASLMLLLKVFGFKLEAALWCGVLFALHPSHVLVVGNISYRSASMGAMFLFSGLSFLLIGNKSYKTTIPGLLLVSAAILSRESALLAPLFFALLLPSIPDEKRSTKRSYLTIFGLMILVSVSGFFLRAGILGSSLGRNRGVVLSSLTTWKLFAESVFRGMKHLFWPLKLEILQVVPAPSLHGVVFGVIILAALAICWYLLRKSILGTGIAWMLMGMTPLIALAVTGLNQNPAYVFLASAGLTLVCVPALLRLKHQWVARCILGAMAIFLAFNSFDMSKSLQSSKLFWTRAIQDSPEQSTLYMNFGRALAVEGLDEEAIAAWDKALVLNPANYKAFMNKGNIAFRAAKWDEAIKNFLTARSLISTSPLITWKLAAAYFSAGQMEAARKEVSTALSLTGGPVPNPSDRARLLLNLGFDHAAIAAAKEAVNRRPDNPSLKVNLGYVLIKTGRLDEAGDILNYLQGKYPDIVHVWLLRANYESATGNTESAILWFNKVLEVDPDNLDARQKLGMLQQSTS